CYVAHVDPPEVAPGSEARSGYEEARVHLGVVGQVAVLAVTGPDAIAAFRLDRLRLRIGAGRHHEGRVREAAGRARLLARQDALDPVFRPRGEALERGRDPLTRVV